MITLNKFAVSCREMALAKGLVTSESSPTPLFYDIAHNWERLKDATKIQGTGFRKWNGKEEKAAEVMISTLTYLQQMGCRDIEQLLRDTLSRLARQ